MFVNIKNMPNSTKFTISEQVPFSVYLINKQTYMDVKETGGRMTTSRKKKINLRGKWYKN